MKIFLESFGSRYGSKTSYNAIINCLNLPNPPDYLMALGCGTSKPIAQWFSKQKEIDKFLSKLIPRLLNYVNLAKTDYLSIGVKCLGGRHRSVYIVEKLDSILKKAGFEVTISHKRLNKN